MLQYQNKYWLLLNYTPVLLGNIFFIAIIGIIYLNSGLRNALEVTIYFYFIQMVFFAHSYHLIGQLLKNTLKKGKQIFLRLILLLAMGFGIVFTLKLIFPNTEQAQVIPLWTFMILWLSSAILGILLISLFRFYRHQTDQKAYNYAPISELEKVKTELYLLKDQINTHFLFNTLNNIYGLVQLNDPRAPQMISTLSNILRYLVDDGMKATVSLEKEKALIESYLKLYLLKSKGLEEQVNFSYKSTCDSCQIRPMILIELIEEGFKYGNLEDNPLNYIKIKLETLHNELHFCLQCRNRSNSSNNKKLRNENFNAKKRLRVSYPKRHVLQKKIENGTFIIDLKLGLK